VRQLYFDNAATSWPKPPAVLRALAGYLRRGGGNPGRSGHARAIGAGRIVLEARELLAELLGVRDPAHVVFTKNATEALNLALLGTLKPGDHVVAGSMEHNSVLRPLTALHGRGVEVSVVEADASGRLDPRRVEAALRGNTRLVVLNHASNVCGTVADATAVGRACRERGVLFLVDAAQSAGCLPIDVEALRVDFLAFSGHKGLLGPQGTGGLYVRQPEGLEPLLYGGTGSLSDREEQPQFLPDRFESGTLNVHGLAGLAAGLRYLLGRGVQQVAAHDRGLLELLLQALDGVPGVTLYGPVDGTAQVGVLSVNVAGLSPSEAGRRLEREFGILTRIGLHCAPRAHRTLGTFPDGTVRLSWGPFTREAEVRTAARALLRLAREARTRGGRAGQGDGARGSPERRRTPPTDARESGGQAR
jgi:cysteine desulfurase/selenocysteine lyase